MGYRTYHNLEVIEGDDSLIHELIVECSEAAFAIDIDGGANTCTRWDSMDEDMRKFSKKHPKAVFEMYGDGDDSDDHWYTYYKNGEAQECPVELVHDNYDETKLK